jgi:hypothetical protein
MARTPNTNKVGRVYDIHSRLLLNDSGKECILLGKWDWECMELYLHGSKCLVVLSEPFVCKFDHLFDYLYV